MKIDLKKTMGLEKLSEILPVPKEAIEGALEEGEIPSYDICGVKLVTEEDLERYIEDSYSESDDDNLEEAMDTVSEAYERQDPRLSWSIPDDIVKSTIQTAFKDYGDMMAKTLAFKVEELAKDRNKEIDKLNKRLTEEQAKAVKAETVAEGAKKTVETMSKAKNEALDKVKKLEDEKRVLEYQLSQKKEVTVLQDESILADCIAKDEEIAKLKRELETLKERQGNQNFKAGDGFFKTTEAEFFADEHKALLLLLASKELKKHEGNTGYTRLKVLLQDIIQNNPMPEGYKEFCDKVDALNGSDENAFDKGLKGLGFEEKSQNGHRKLVFRDDNRFCATLALTPSDRRAYHQAKATIKKTLTF